ncbi:MAG: energy-coupling factor transporter transmembrane protein EcfT [Oscillospiraceae bacterium]|nr:energy-coupling factor transporter transmembrane protein EcfT [Oscillospiraceae bacterium]
MLKDITLGQFFPGSSIIHKLDPRMKIIMSMLYITAIFSTSSLYTLGGVFLFNIFLIFLSGISFKVMVKALKPLAFIIIFTGTINIFMQSGGKLLFEFGIIKVYLEGVVFAVFMILRIISLVSATSLLISYTTSPTVLTDAIERLLSPLKKIKIPVHEFALMMSIALRFIPTLLDETEKIINAQKARGADFYSGNILKRAKALVPVLIPLIISAFRRADELATAMECRCYKGGEGRTKMKRLEYAARDFAAFTVFAALTAGVYVVQGLVL